MEASPDHLDAQELKDFLRADFVQRSIEEGLVRTLSTDRR